MKSLRTKKFAQAAVVVALSTSGMIASVSAADTGRTAPGKILVLQPAGITSGAIINATPELIITKGRGYVVPQVSLNGHGACDVRIDLGNGQPTFDWKIDPTNPSPSAEHWGKPVTYYGGALAYSKAGVYNLTVKGIANAPGLVGPACTGSFSQQVTVVLEK